MDIWAWCKCEPGYTCVMCKVLVGVVLAALGVAAGYFIGRRKK